MRLRAFVMRVGRVAVLALAAWLMFRWLEPQGLGWLVLVLFGVAFAAWVGLRAYRVRRARAEEARAERYASALLHPPERPAVVRELREAIAALDPSRARAERARLTLVLAELLEADGEPREALEALEALDDLALDARLGAMVGHARAVAHLSAGEPERARDALDELPGASGEREIDLRVRLLRGVVQAETGDPEGALEIAEQARDEARGDADLKAEARVLKAVALDAAGDRADALKVMHAIGEEVLEVLAVLGLPRVRGLAAAALAERED